MGTLAYILSFALGAGPVPGLLVPEITGARIRGGCPAGLVLAESAPVHAARCLRSVPVPRPSPGPACMRLACPGATKVHALASAHQHRSHTRLPAVLPAPGRAVSLAMVTHWVCNFAIGQLFLAAVSAFGVSTVYLFFAAVCFACVAFVGKAVVETKGRRWGQRGVCGWAGCLVVMVVGRGCCCLAPGAASRLHGQA